MPLPTITKNLILAALLACASGAASAADKAEAQASQGASQRAAQAEDQAADERALLDKFYEDLSRSLDEMAETGSEAWKAGRRALEESYQRFRERLERSEPREPLGPANRDLQEI